MLTLRRNSAVSRYAKAIAAVARQFHLESSLDSERQRELRRDLKVHHDRHGLKQLAIELLDARGETLRRLRWDGQGMPANGAAAAVARGEILDGLASPVTGWKVRVIVSRTAFAAHADADMRGRWRPATPPKQPAAAPPATPPPPATSVPPAPPVPRRPPAPVRSASREDTRRQRLTIVETGTLDFAFAVRDNEPEAGKVYLNVRYAPPGFTFERGKAITARLVTKPQGVQAREIQAA